MIWDTAEERCSLCIPASVCLHNQIFAPYHNSLAHPFSRKNCVSELPTCAADLGVVLLHSISEVYLFYRGQVYSRLEVSGLRNLPERMETRYYPLRLLIDADTRGQEPIIPGRSELWPIQACSPKHLQWKQWKKQFGAAEWGMPLWDMEELMEGYVSGLFPLPTTDPGHVVW